MANLKIRIYEIDKTDVQWAMHESTLLGPLGAFSGAGDMMAIAGVWATLLWMMAQNHGIKLAKEKSKELCMCIADGVMKYIAGCKAATKLFHLIPGAGTVIAIAGSTLENIVFTYRFARSVTDIMLKEHRINSENWDSKVTKIIDEFAFENWIEDMNEIVRIYTAPDGYLSDILDETKEKVDETGLKIVNISSEIITSEKFKAIERGVWEFKEDVKDTVTDGAKYVGKTIVNGAKHIGKWFKDNW